MIKILLILQKWEVPYTNHYDKDQPIVALLNVGSEEIKGTEDF